MTLEFKWIVVVGGTSKIGRATARAAAVGLTRAVAVKLPRSG